MNAHFKTTLVALALIGLAASKKITDKPGQLDNLNDDGYYIDGNATLLEFDDDDDDNDERFKLERI